MENIKTEYDLSPEDYEIFRQVMLEEAWIILSDRSKYIKNDSLNTASKIFHLEKISDFFYLEDEFDIVNDFNILKKTVIIRHFLLDHVEDI